MTITPAAAADDLAARLTAAGLAAFGRPVVATPGPFREATARQLGRAGVRVDVTEADEGTEVLARGVRGRTLTVGVGVQAVCEPADRPRLSALTGLVSAIVDAATGAGHVAGTPLAGLPTAEPDPLYDPDRLDAGIFEAVVLVTYTFPAERRTLAGGGS